MAAKDDNYFSKSRIEAFSDGVFTIVVTLLVFEIKLPPLQDPHSSPELVQALVKLLPKVLSWMVSFLIVCVIWINHHRLFSRIKIITHSLFWLNANLLLWCAFIPFPTALMGDYLHNRLALVVFGIILALMSASFTLIRLNALKNAFVLEDGTDLRLYKRATVKSVLYGPVLYLCGAALSWAHPFLGFAAYTFVPFYFIFFNSKNRKQD